MTPQEKVRGRYRKRPVEVEAVDVLGEFAERLKGVLLHDQTLVDAIERRTRRDCDAPAVGGAELAQEGRLVQETFFPCIDECLDEFEATYEPVDQDGGEPRLEIDAEEFEAARHDPKTRAFFQAADDYRRSLGERDRSVSRDGGIEQAARELIEVYRREYEEEDEQGAGTQAALGRLAAAVDTDGAAEVSDAMVERACAAAFVPPVSDDRKADMRRALKVALCAPTSESKGASK